MPRIILLSNPRSGSNYLQDLLTCHPDIDLEGEILNDELGLLQNPLDTIQDTLSSLHKTFIGFKLFPEQLYGHKLHFGELVQSIGVTHVIVLWREELLEGFTSRQIAFSHDDWYSTKKSNVVRKIKVDPQEFQEYINQLTFEWQTIGSQWPVDIRPIFVKFEDLIKQPTKEVKRVLAELSCTSDHVVFVTPSERQNPAPIHEKVTNYNDLAPHLKNQTLNVQSILQEKINLSLQIPQDLLQFAPDREPCMPAGGWRYRVAEPYLPAIAKQNAFDTIHSGIISSAGFWPKELANKLRSIFKYPVAQPCSNGFTALLLAMQCADIQEGDEVIVPTMTMVAVPNAVYYLRATPVFADNAPNGSYNPGWKEYEAKASARTKAVIVTHTYGVPATDIEIIAEQCRLRGWVLIEDISECVGVSCVSNGLPKLLGTFGDYSIASLYANKIIHGGDGGFVLAKQASVGKRLASIVNHGFTPSFHFVHFEPAPNAKIHGIGAAIASGCLDELEYIMKHRSQLAKWYRTNLTDAPVILMPQCGPRDTPWVFGIQCRSKQERTQLRAFMAKHCIETRDFFFNLHLQPAYMPREEKRQRPSLTNAEILGSTGFYLPTHTNLNEKDVEYICNILKLYFCSEDTISSTTPPGSPSRLEIKQAVQIQPDSFSVEVKKYRGSGEALGTLTRGHVYIEAVKLGMDCEEALFHEKYDKTHLLLDSIQNLLERAEKGKDPLASNIQSYFRPFIAYFESQSLLEQPINQPWLQTVDLTDKLFEISCKLPTTTDPETFQLLAWLIKELKPSTIWEIGCWMGSATALMAEVSKEVGTKCMIFACDAFKWQAWMQPFLHDKNSMAYHQEGKTFLPIFEENLKPFEDQVTPVEWPYDISSLPEILKNQRPQLVFLDITQEDEDLEEIWALIKENLIPNETIILFNGLARTSIPFFTRHASELKAFAKPQTMAKAFLFVDPNVSPKKLETYEEIQQMMRSVLPLKRSLKFLTNPEWNHHHDNVFCKAVDLLRKEYHSDGANILFIPAVEETMCDDLETLMENPWIGIIHSAKSHLELFYTPDLERLCTRPRYLAALKNCMGLFTLTQFQTNYLKAHLPSQISSRIPIQSVFYPIQIKQDVRRTTVPELMKANTQPIELLHIGSFARDFDFFFKTPIPKNFVKVLVVGDESVQEATTLAPKDVILTPRLSAEEYEIKLQTSVVFLTLKHEGVANTLILECISQSVPMLSPNISSCVEYLGESYPLFYDPQKPEQVEELLTLENIEMAISYLKQMDKSKFGYERFVEDVKHGIVMLSLPPGKMEGELEFNPIYDYSSQRRPKFDVTLCICSYKRTHHLPKILDSLWNNQDFNGTFQIVIWNNNDCRTDLVHSYARKYLQTSSGDKKSLEVISSTENHYCSVRFAMTTLMKSECLLICDDDVIPGPNFISFFYSSHQKYPKDVLCVRGHEFLEHKLSTRDPMKVWMDYDAVRFRDDGQPEQLIHFVHADACLIPKQALHEVASVSMADSSFHLVDDYWMSFVLSHKFNRKLRKLCIAGLNINPIIRTEDSETVGLALHTRPEVRDARLRLYVHHMLQGWPCWNTKTSVSTTLSEEEENVIKNEKARFWKETPPQLAGFNISSLIDDDGIHTLSQKGTQCVRIGAVGIGEKKFYEFSGFLTEPDQQLEKLQELVGKLGKVGICVVLTLDRRLASPETWKVIAEAFGQVGNVVGYDLINEPFTELEANQHWTDMEVDANLGTGMTTVVEKYRKIVYSIRQVDKLTPIILEPTFWAHIGALEKFPIEELMKVDDNLLISIHFYEPMRLTSRVQNKGRYSFPGSIPVYDGVKFSEEIYWDDKAIFEKLKKAKLWADEKKLQIFLGELGTCRDIKGAPAYLEAVITACKEVGMMGFLFSFRDPDWEAMDYEFGINAGNCLKLENSENPFIPIIQF